MFPSADTPHAAGAARVQTLLLDGQHFHPWASTTPNPTPALSKNSPEVPGLQVEGNHTALYLSCTAF